MAVTARVVVHEAVGEAVAVKFADADATAEEEPVAELVAQAVSLGESEALADSDGESEVLADPDGESEVLADPGGEADADADQDGEADADAVVSRVPMSKGSVPFALDSLGERLADADAELDPDGLDACAEREAVGDDDTSADPVSDSVNTADREASGEPE